MADEQLPHFAAILPSPRLQTTNYACKFDGYVTIPTIGIYTFFASSDAGSKRHIGANQVVNNDGLHGTAETSGTIGLKPGKHAVTATCFQKGGGTALTVSYQGPGIVEQTIPDAALSILAGIDAWRIANFGTTTGIAGDLADPDGDGIPNLLESALGLDRSVAGVLPGCVPEGDQLTLTYKHRKPPTDVTYRIEVTGDVSGGWSNTGVTEQILTDDGTFQTVRATDPVAISGNMRRFIHLKVTR